MTEIAAQTMHNLLPMRGALVRDPLIWSKHLGGALQRYGAKSDVLIAQHNWPVWGADRVQGFLKKQRDTYKYVHDQTVRLMNHGHVGAEIADTLKMPASLNQDWSTHAFYGDLKHNVKAVYQRYLGYYDGNPANLYALPPVPAAQKPSSTWAAPTGGAAAAREGGLRQGRVPLGGPDGVAAGVRGPGQPGGPRAGRRRLRATGLSGRILHGTQRPSARCLGTAQRPAQDAGREHAGAGRDPRPDRWTCSSITWACG